MQSTLFKGNAIRNDWISFFKSTIDALKVKRKTNSLYC